MYKSWNMREIIITVILSIVLGLVYVIWGPIWEAASIAAGPIGGEAVYGIWFMASVLVAYIIRKPGAALLAEMLAALGELLAGSIFGLSMLITAAIQGVLSEAAFAVFGYRKYNLPVLMLAGILPAAGSFVWEFFKGDLGTYGTSTLVTAFFVRLVSGAILTGILGKVVADLLAKTGVLNKYAIIRGARNEKPM